MKAFIETENWIWNLSKNENLMVADQFGTKVKNYLIMSKNEQKEIRQILELMIKAVNGIYNNDFNVEYTPEIEKLILRLSSLHNEGSEPKTYVEYKNSLTWLLDILIHL